MVELYCGLIIGYIGSVALLLRAPAHPLHARIANIFGTSLSEATVRPNPRWSCSGWSGCPPQSCSAAAAGWTRPTRENEAAKLAQELGHLQPFIAAFPQECTG